MAGYLVAHWRGGVARLRKNVISLQMRRLCFTNDNDDEGSLLAYYG
jgi:hypothetical protein